MKFLIALLACFQMVSVAAHNLEIGKPVPDIQAQLIEGTQRFVLSEQIGKVVVINFWATWCAPCLTEMPLLDAYYQAHKAHGLEILAISMDDPAALEQVRTVARKYSFPVAMKADASFRGLGRIWRLPTSFVIDRQGNLQHNGQIGPAELDPAALDTLVTPLLAAH